MKSALLIVLFLNTGCVHRTISGFPVFAPKHKIQGALDAVAGDEHIRLLQEKLKNDPDDVQARLELAGAFEQYRLWTDAFEQYSEVFHRASSEQAAVGVGRTASALGRAGDAIPLLEGFLKKAQSPDAWDALGMLYEGVGKLAAEEKALREALVYAGESDRIHNNLGHNLLLQKKAEEAAAEFKRALELNPQSVTSHNNLGVALARLGDLKGALEQFEFAADTATAHNNLAVALFEIGNYEQSREELVKALSIKQHFAPALSNFKLVQERIRERTDVGPQKKGPEER